VSEDLGGADNQQESLSSEERRCWFLAGFVEGEGSVHVSIKRHQTLRLGYYFQPEFFIYQHRVRRELLEIGHGVLPGRRDPPEAGQSGRPGLLRHIQVGDHGACAPVSPDLHALLREDERLRHLW
jgi:hypothetical protein